MNAQELRNRTFSFAMRILHMVDALPSTISGQMVARQIARSGTSIAANYRAALRGKSRADFAHKITIVLEETDETAFWLELTAQAGILPVKRVASLQQEALELTKIFAATRRTARNHQS